MKNIYDMLWVDAITRIKKTNPDSNWKFISLFAVSMINAFNWMTIILWMEYFEGWDLPRVKVDFFGGGFPGPQLNFAPTFFLLYFAPFFIINYFLIFYKGRYLKLIKKYPDERKHLYFTYVICSMALCLVSGIIISILKS